MKIIRLLCIPVLIGLIIWISIDIKNLAFVRTELGGLERSANGTWPKAYAKFDGHLILSHGLPYKKGDPMTVVSRYSYQAEGEACKGTRFEFSMQKGDKLDFPPTDRRLHDMIKTYCTGAPRKTTLKNSMQYEYSCYPIEVRYDPKEPCLSYIDKPLDPAATQAAMQKKIRMFYYMIALKIVLAALSIGIGVWPLMAGNRIKK